MQHMCEKCVVYQIKTRVAKNVYNNAKKRLCIPTAEKTAAH